jgi:nitroimidazol reductase NimA-like FMN-containing flavoprotein (pyridoxamine 5'-phosphate oxidase superfamily)
VIVTGEAERLTERKEIDGAMKFIMAVNPTLTPAISIHWLDQWIRSNVDVVYRITPATITGRTTLERSTPNK